MAMKRVLKYDGETFEVKFELKDGYGMYVVYDSHGLDIATAFTPAEARRAAVDELGYWQMQVDYFIQEVAS